MNLSSVSELASADMDGNYPIILGYGCEMIYMYQENSLSNSALNCHVLGQSFGQAVYANDTTISVKF